MNTQAVDRLDRALHVLKQRGERLTVQRRLVLEALSVQRTHLTVADIQLYLREQRDIRDLEDPTIYRILQWLKALHLVSQTDLGDGLVYQLIEGPLHHHLVCLTCGRITDIDDDLFSALRIELRARHAFEPRIDHMAVFGWCRDCQPKGEDGA